MKGYFINQRKSAIDLIQLANLKVDTPRELNVKYSKDDGEYLNDATLYRKLVGSLIYLTMIRPDIAYVVQLVSQLVSAPCNCYLS